MKEPLHGLKVTISVGLVVSPVPAHIPSLLDAADEALYQVKNSGRNRVHRADFSAPVTSDTRASP